MYKNVLQAIEGIGIYPMISMFIFISIFVIAIIWFFRADKTRLQQIAEIPLEPNFPIHDKRKEV